MDEAHPSLDRRGEAALRRAVLRGDEDAWEALVLAHWEPLARFARHDLRVLEAQDELLQDVWLIGVRKIASFDPEQGSFLGWMKGIATNVARERRRRRAEPHDAELLLAEATLAPDAATREAVQVVLGELDPIERKLLVSRYIDGLSLRDLAARVGRTTKAVEAALTRARRTFRERFQRRFADEQGTGP